MEPTAETFAMLAKVSCRGVCTPIELVGAHNSVFPVVMSLLLPTLPGGSVWIVWGEVALFSK